MPSLYLRLIGYTLLTVIVFGAGFKVADWRDTGKLEALRTVDATDRANGEEAVRKDLQAKLAQVQAVSTNNADSLLRLANENATLAADRDANVALARRLLAGQARSIPASGVVSQTGHQPATPASSGARQDDSLAQLVADVGDECTRNADRLDTLIAQIAPQLK